MSVKIRDLLPTNDSIVKQVATLLLDGFSEPDAWSTMEAALTEVIESFNSGRLSRVAFNSHGVAVGWIGAIAHYGGRVWEIHPLVVHPTWQGKGFGRALVEDLEHQVYVRGGLTLQLGTDDTHGRTTLSGVDLYPDVWAHIAAIKNLGRHPYEFYQKLGFVITGVVPDANGLGKPDILMAKRVGDGRSRDASFT
jgi:aminoglycoside 6'-N-acetyltransferase I